MRRTTRLDVGLAMGFAGAAYLVWALVAGVSRGFVQDMIRAFTHTTQETALPNATRFVRVFFVDAGVVIDVVGLAWLLVSLLLVVLGSRQKIRISWAWVAACLQGFVAALGGILVAWAVNLPYQRAMLTKAKAGESATALETLSKLSLAVIVPIAILLWVTSLIWLLVERARFNRRGPTLTDGLRTHTYR